MERRKQKDLSKVASVVAFVEETRRCRQQFLQEYFDEFTTITCGICDNCLKQKKQDADLVPIEIYTKYRQKILEIIPEKASQVVDYQYFNNRNYVKEVIRRMIENEEIRCTELGILEKKQ